MSWSAAFRAVSLAAPSPVSLWAATHERV